jgi:hypothetical protein
MRSRLSRISSAVKGVASPKLWEPINIFIASASGQSKVMETKRLLIYCTFDDLHRTCTGRCAASGSEWPTAGQTNNTAAPADLRAILDSAYTRRTRLPRQSEMRRPVYACLGFSLQRHDDQDYPHSSLSRSPDCAVYLSDTASFFYNTISVTNDKKCLFCRDLAHSELDHLMYTRRVFFAHAALFVGQTFRLPADESVEIVRRNELATLKKLWSIGFIR